MPATENNKGSKRFKFNPGNEGSSRDDGPFGKTGSVPVQENVNVTPPPVKMPSMMFNNSGPRQFQSSEAHPNITVRRAHASVVGKSQ